MRERNEQYLAPRFPDGSTYCIVMRVQVFNQDPLTPDLSKEENRLFEWCDADADAEAGRRDESVGAGCKMGNSFHIESHAALLQKTPNGEPPYRGLDAIVVPTIRPQSLQTAAVLASQIGCALVILCSTPEQATQALSGFGPVTEDL